MNTQSKPSDLKITDLRVAALTGVPFRSTLIRIDTNQGLYGLGEIRDGASDVYALMLKARLLGENPCEVDRLFRKIKPFGGHGRLGGGVCAVEMALMDLAGKAYGVPAYQLAGGKFRDEVRCYCDTDSTPDAEEMGRRLKARIDMGFTFLKMDIGLRLLDDVPGAISSPSGMLKTRNVMHPFSGIQLTDRGIEHLCDYVRTVRDFVGYEIPLAADHFGHLNVESCIRLAKALEPFTLAWLEDMVPWQFADQYARLSNACSTPICTGEDIYCTEGFLALFESRAIAVAHPDLATSGGIMETKRIGELAEQHGIAMALHMAATPVATMASVHCAAATANFMVLENHAVDIPEWNNIVTGLPNPIIQNGFIKVPETPGLGVDLNEEGVRRFLDPERPGYFEATTEWDGNGAFNDRLWS